MFSLFLLVLISMIYTLKDFSLFNSNYRLEIGTLNPIWISRAVLEFFLIYYFFGKPDIKVMVLFGVVAVLILYASGSKGPIVAFILTVFIYNLRSLSYRKKIMYLAIIIPIFASLYSYLAVIVENEFIRDRFFTLIPEGDPDSLIEVNRGIFIPFLLKVFFSSDIITLLFGGGLGNSGFFMYGSSFTFRYYPHNLFVEILLELGLINLILLTTLLIYVIVSNRSLFVYLLIYFTINSMFSGDLILNEFIFLYLGFVLVDTRNNVVKRSITRPNLDLIQ